MKQPKKKEIRPLKRTLHFGEGEEWSYFVGSQSVFIRTPDRNTTYTVHLTDITGQHMPDIERDRWKDNWKGVPPKEIKGYIRRHLRNPDKIGLSSCNYMATNDQWGRKWHKYQDCPELKRSCLGDTVPVELWGDDKLEEALGKVPNRLNLCPRCAEKYEEIGTCADCHTNDQDWYMVHQEVWRTAVPEKEEPTHLCWTCLSTRIQRPLFQEDFPMDVLFNSILCYEAIMALPYGSKRHI